MFENLSEDQIFDIYLEDANHAFSGWDFSYITQRIVIEPLDWSYPSIIIPFLRSVDSMLDMGTGGGEFLCSLQPLPKNTFATESYKSNIPLAKKNLEPIGVKVIPFRDDKKLPLKDEQFDLIINRHESYCPYEVIRLLKKGGFFITQQVGGTNDLELNRFLGSPINNVTVEYQHWNLAFAINELKETGFHIIQQKECFPKTKCFDIGAIIFQLKAIPWQVKDFTTSKYYSKLKELHLKIQKEGFFCITSHRFLIVAKKPY